MEKLFKSKSLIAVIAVLLVVAAAIFLPKLIRNAPADVSEAQSADRSVWDASRGAWDAGSLQSAESAPDDESAAAPPEESAQSAETSAEASAEASAAQARIAEDGSYTSKEDVALYLRTYGKLPQNYITKSEANKLGWEGGDLWRFAPGKSIGGDRFGNREGLLPKKSGRTWYECDIDYNGGSRGAKRICYSNDGLIYYTDDHYASFSPVEQEAAD